MTVDASSTDSSATEARMADAAASLKASVLVEALPYIRRFAGKTVVVKSPQVPKPVAVRYGWSDFPVVNLYNSAGLPASPFRTDDWPGVTWPK